MFVSGGDCWGDVPNRQRELKKKRKDLSQKSSIYTARSGLCALANKREQTCLHSLLCLLLLQTSPTRKLDFSAGGCVTCTTFVSQPPVDNRDSPILPHSTGVSTKPDLVTRSKPPSSNIISEFEPSLSSFLFCSSSSAPFSQLAYFLSNFSCHAR